MFCVFRFCFRNEIHDPLLFGSIILGAMALVHSQHLAEQFAFGPALCFGEPLHFP